MSGKNSLIKKTVEGAKDLHEYGANKPPIRNGALTIGAAVFVAFLVLPGGNFIGDALSGLVAGEGALLVAAQVDRKKGG